MAISEVKLRVEAPRQVSGGLDCGGVKVPRYRMYSLNEHGRIDLSGEVNADTDREAIALRRDWSLNGRCELWEERRLVATMQGADLVVEHA